MRLARAWTPPISAVDAHAKELIYSSTCSLHTAPWFPKRLHTPPEGTSRPQLLSPEQNPAGCIHTRIPFNDYACFKRLSSTAYVPAAGYGYLQRSVDRLRHLGIGLRRRPVHICRSIRGGNYPQALVDFAHGPFDKLVDHLVLQRKLGTMCKSKPGAFGRKVQDTHAYWLFVCVFFAQKKTFLASLSFVCLSTPSKQSTRSNPAAG